MGEEVEFDFVLLDATGRFLPPKGVADYCAAQIGEDRVESEPDENGHFRFRYRFDRLRAGEEVDVRAAAYAQVGSRDFVRVRGQWMRTQEGAVESDRPVARDTIALTGYEAEVELRLQQPPDELDRGSGLLRFRRLDGQVANVYIERRDRPGFSLSGPDGRGYYTVRYRPTGEQLNPTETTPVEFSVYDVGGRKHGAAMNLETP